VKGFLILSARHGLIPLFHRLKRTGHETHLVVWNSRYSTAWAGLVEPILKRDREGITQESLAPAIEAAQRGDLIVITDVPMAAEWFSGAKLLYGPGPDHPTKPQDRVLFGGWFDGEHTTGLHLLVPDWGIWPGGMGPSGMGGLTLIRPNGGTLVEPITGALNQVTERLKAASYRGLVSFDVVEEPQTGELLLHGLQTGWPLLHTAAFLAELGGLNSLLLAVIAPRLERRFVTVLPVSAPPWPNQRQGERRPPVEITGLSPAQVGQCFWYDITIAPQEKKLFTAGHDGLIAVATGSGDVSPALARGRALGLASRLQVPEKQFRPDVGLQVDVVLATLEERWGVLV